MGNEGGALSLSHALSPRHNGFDHVSSVHSEQMNLVDDNEADVSHVFSSSPTPGMEKRVTDFMGLP